MHLCEQHNADLYCNACPWHHSRQEKPFELEGHKLAPRFPINVENMRAAPPSRWGSIKCGGKGRLESIHKESMGALFGSKIDKRTVINKGQVRLLL